jgi:hypothetical protein
VTSDQLWGGGGGKALETGDLLGCWPSGSLVDRIFYRECRPYRVSLFDVKIIMSIMRVLMVELLCPMVAGRIPVLECLLLGACGCLWLRPVLFGIKWPRCLRSGLWGHLPGTGNSQSWPPRGPGVCQVGAWGGVRSGWQVVKSCPSMAIEGHKRTGGPSARSGRTISGMGYLVPQPFYTRDNRVVSRFVGS